MAGSMSGQWPWSSAGRKQQEAVCMAERRTGHGADRRDWRQGGRRSYGGGGVSNELCPQVDGWILEGDR